MLKLFWDMVKHIAMLHSFNPIQIYNIHTSHSHVLPSIFLFVFATIKFPCQCFTVWNKSYINNINIILQYGSCMAAHIKLLNILLPYEHNMLTIWCTTDILRAWRYVGIYMYESILKRNIIKNIFHFLFRILNVRVLCFSYMLYICI